MEFYSSKKEQSLPFHHHLLGFCDCWMLGKSKHILLKCGLMVMNTMVQSVTIHLQQIQDVHVFVAKKTLLRICWILVDVENSLIFLLASRMSVNTRILSRLRGSQ